MNTERNSYEAPEISLLPIGKTDVITTSGAFNGRGDDVATWARYN